MSERERKEEGKRHQESDTNRGRKKRNREIYIEIYRKKKNGESDSYAINTFYCAVFLLDFHNLGGSRVSDGLEGH